MELDTTLFLARLLGVFSVILGLSMLVRRKTISEVFHKMEDDRALVYTVGLAAIVGGLLLVLNHNIWDESAAAVLVTLLGWFLFVEGIIYAVASKRTIEHLFRWLQRKRVYFSLSVFYLVLGLYLASWGFFELTLK